MKCGFYIVTTIVCVLSIALADSRKHTAEMVHSEVMSYVLQNMKDIRMMRGNPVHLDCYNTFIPLINSSALNASNVSNVCVSEANSKRDQKVANLENDRKEIAVEVSRVDNFLASCSKSEGMGYFNCLAGNADWAIKSMETIKNKSRDVISQNFKNEAAIDKAEQDCLMNAVDEAKSKTDKAFKDLKVCLEEKPK